MNIRERSAKVKRMATSLGFSHVGFASARPLEEEGRKFTEWLDRGYHASMVYMKRAHERRLDPSALLPEAVSVISLAVNYYSDASHTDAMDIGKISRYAWGDDYHKIIRAKLKDLANFIQTFESCVASKVYVDTGPLLEKAWASRAGIGWLGKHTNIITRDHGSWIFLGEILTSLELEYDSPATDFCGTCTRCIDACPTAAIVEPYVVDSNRCISFHTIESRGEDIPEELGKKFTNWIFGCDVCQDVCPWNRFRRSTTDGRFHPRPVNRRPDLSHLASLTEEEFNRRFAGSPVGRATYRGLMRNVLNSMRTVTEYRNIGHHGE